MTKFFVSCDWGTSQFRVRLVAADDGRVVAAILSDEGVARIARGATAANRQEQYRAVAARALVSLARQAGRHLGSAPVVISGMASSSIGWHELSYAKVPWPLDGAGMIWHELDPIAGDDGTHRVILLSGVRSTGDVMRGEETQVLGLFQSPSAAALAQRSIVVLPGTHSKHVHVETMRIVGFQTFMTGELFEVIGRHSILRHSVGDSQRAGGSMIDEQRASFIDGVRQAGELPLAAALFRVRTRQVLDGQDVESNRAFLSGVLVGGELAYLRDDAFAGQPLVLCAGAAVHAHYRAAFEALELGSRVTAITPQRVETLSALGQMLIARRLGVV